MVLFIVLCTGYLAVFFTYSFACCVCDRCGSIVMYDIYTSSSESHLFIRIVQGPRLMSEYEEHMDFPERPSRTGEKEIDNDERCRNTTIWSQHATGTGAPGMASTYVYAQSGTKRFSSSLSSSLCRPDMSTDKLTLMKWHTSSRSVLQ